MSDWKNVQYKDGKLKTSEGGSGGASNFADLDDVNISNLQNGQVPKYNSTTEKWENKEDSLANLSDVSMLTLSDKQVLSYNSRTSKWENKSNSVSRLSDVSLNSPSDGDILRYNAQNNEWENTTLPDSWNVYSEQETIVAEWSDGKPLYRKNLKCTFTSDTYDFTIGSNFQIKRIEGGVYKSSGSYDFIHLGYGNISADKVQGYQTSSTNFRIQNSYYQSRNKGEFIIYYTKTTD